MTNYTLSRRFNFGRAMGSCFKKFARFSGRARRSEFWFWMLFFAILTSVMNNNPMGCIALTPLLLPTWAVTVRRLHDTGHSGWLLVSPLFMLGVCIAWTIFFGLLDFKGWKDQLTYSTVCFIGALVLYSITIALNIWIICLMFKDGKKETNRYGESPKYIKVVEQEEQQQEQEEKPQEEQEEKPQEEQVKEEEEIIP